MWNKRGNIEKRENASGRESFELFNILADLPRNLVESFYCRPAIGPFIGTTEWSRFVAVLNAEDPPWNTRNRLESAGLGASISFIVGQKT